MTVQDNETPWYSSDIDVVLDEKSVSKVSGPKIVSFPLYVHLTENLKLVCGPFEVMIPGTHKFPAVMKFDLPDHDIAMLDKIEEWLKQNYGEVKRHTRTEPNYSSSSFHIQD